MACGATLDDSLETTALSSVYGVTVGELRHQPPTKARRGGGLVIQLYGTVNVPEIGLVRWKPGLAFTGRWREYDR